MLYHGTFADSQRFKGFQEQITEVTVKFFADLFDVGLRFIREGIA